MGASGPQKPRAVASVGSCSGTPFDLTGRVALVTGASRGLGAAIASAFAEAGADLILWARHARRLERHADTLRSSEPQASPHDRRGGRLSGAPARRTPRHVLAHVVDVTDRASVRRAVHTALRRFGHIDVLVNNAGIWDGDAALTLTRRAWDRVVETDLTSVFFVSQTVAPAMIKQGYGKIINLASTAGVLAILHGGAYGTVKAGLMHLTRILAVEWGPYGIRVNGIAPGVFRTDMTRDLFADRRWARNRQAEIPLRRFGEPDDIKGLTLFLASRASDHLTGQTIIIDGGACLTV